MPYDPNEPRVPAGSAEGGEWTNDPVYQAARRGAGLPELPKSKQEAKSQKNEFDKANDLYEKLKDKYYNDFSISFQKKMDILEALESAENVINTHLDTYDFWKKWISQYSDLLNKN
jgi:hypothetical protein